MTGDSPRLRLGVLGVVVMSLFAALLARLWYLQVLAAPELREEAQLNSVRLVSTEAPRGRILDRHGRVLVDNRTVSAVVVSRQDAQRHPEVLGRLSRLLGVPEAEFRKRLDDPRFTQYKPVPVAEDVPEEKLVYIREHQAEFPGVYDERLSRRVYPYGPIAAHLLGYVGQINDRELESRRSGGYKEGDTIGKAGAELAFETQLRGRPELTKFEVDSRERVLRSLGRQPAVPGSDVLLNIDLDVQRLAEESLAQGLETARRTYDYQQAKFFIAPAGSVVVSDPRDGAVIAMASIPTYNPSEFVNGITQDRFLQLQDPGGNFPLTNRVIQGLYAPASTFKLVTSLAALAKDLITPRTTVEDTGSILIGNPPEQFRNAFGQAFGRVDLSRALTVSSDVYFYILGRDLWGGRGKYGYAIQDMAKALGMGRPTEVELPFEAQGRVPDPETRKRLHEANPEAFPTADWFTGDNVNLAIGQGELAVTPLQLANAYATFANGGSVYAPRIGGAIRDPVRDRVEPIPARLLRTAELPNVGREHLLEGFLGATADPSGTAYDAFRGFPLDRFPVAGKTGTAQVAGKQDTALFSAFAPAHDPRYVVSVVMEESGAGAAAAAPVARRILEAFAGAPDGLAPVGRSAGRD